MRISHLWVRPELELFGGRWTIQPTADRGCDTASCTKNVKIQKDCFLLFLFFLFLFWKYNLCGFCASLPIKHAMDDSEEEDKMEDALPVWHHHGVGGAQVRLPLQGKAGS